jgi:ATP-dependent 26S proteasome regulatory subunit
MSTPSIKSFMEDEAEAEKKIDVKLTQWITTDGKSFVGISDTNKVIPSGVYEIGEDKSGNIVYSKLSATLNELIELPDSVAKKIIDEIKMFWSLSAKYAKHKIMHKRGILMYGPPGGGKTATIQFLMADIIKRGGIVVKYGRPYLMARGLRILREIEPSKPLVVIMEDIDAIIEEWCESDVLNLLDGIDRIDNAVYIATTNYPEKLGDRVINRPSRFDKRFFVGFPSAEARGVFLKAVAYGVKFDVKKWVADTEEFSIAHLKELFTSVILIGDKYDDALATLRAMKEEKASGEGDKAKPGF